MKKRFCLLTMCFVILSLGACANGENGEEDGSIQVTGTTPYKATINPEAFVGDEASNTISYENAGEAGFTADLANPANNAGFAIGDTYVSIENLIGSPYNDILIGNAEANTLNGGGGDDILNGGAGDDTFILSDDGMDTVIDSEGSNNIYFSSSASTIENASFIQDGTDLFITVVSDSQYLRIQDYYSSPNDLPSFSFHYSESKLEFIPALPDFEVQMTLTGSGTLTGGANHDILNGEGGDDTLNGGGGDDTLNGEGGNDTLNGEGGDDTLNGAGGNDTLNGAGGDDTLNGGADIDELYGNSGDDTLNGGDGNDELYGGTGNNILNGGAGEDTYVTRDAGGHDTILGGSEVEGEVNQIILDLSSAELRQFANFGFVSAVREADGDVKISFTGGIHHPTVFDSNGVRGNNAIYFTNIMSITIENFINGHYDLFTQSSSSPSLLGRISIVEGTDQQDYIIGTAGNDTINGLEGNDVIYGYDGNDEIDGGDGHDEIYGGRGDDILRAGEGTGSFISGGDGSDRIYTIESRNSLYGGKGDDFYYGGSDQDIILDIILNRDGGGGNDFAEGGGGADSIDLGIGTDTVSYENSRDTDGDGSGVTVDLSVKNNFATSTGIGDDAENDQLTNVENLIGSAFKDFLGGDEKVNVLTGLAGDDLLEGGVGADTYVFYEGDGTDTITEVAGDTMTVQFEGSGYVASDFTATNLFARDGGRLLITVGTKNIVVINNAYDANGLSLTIVIQYGSSGSFTSLDTSLWSGL